MRNDIYLDDAISMLAELLEQAINDPYVQKPMSWALYQTWKWADANEMLKEKEDANSN